MKCKECLTWQNRRLDLLNFNTKYVDECYKYSAKCKNKDLIEELKLLIPHFKELLVNHETVRNEPCTEGSYCRIPAL